MSESTGDFKPTKSELAPKPEPGIIRNLDHRIIATGWPQIHKSKWPQAYKELGDSVAEQVQRELALRKGATRDVFGAYRAVDKHGARMVFNLNDRSLQDHLRSVID